MISLIISYYKNLAALDLIFKSLNNQTFKDFEVIISEDAQDDETKIFLTQQREKYTFPISHVWHEDIGFRKTKINNDALRISKGEKIVFIDGDCILHGRFLEVYNNSIVEGKYFYGRRVLLGPKISQKLLATRDLKYLRLFPILFSDSLERQEALYFPYRPTKRKKGREIWGCNWGILRKYIIGVNGFDEDYNLPCYGEDYDVSWRLRSKYKLELVSLKNKAIQYHLYHKLIWDDAINEKGKVIYDEKVRVGRTECLNGIEKYSN